MKKIMLLFVLSFFYLETFAQRPCIKCTLEYFTNQYSNVNFTKTPIDDSTLVLESKDEKCTMVHYFKHNISYLCVLVPNNNNGVNGFVEVLNKSATIISKYQWSYYSQEGGLITIDLMFSDKDKEWRFYYQ